MEKKQREKLRLDSQYSKYLKEIERRRAEIVLLRQAKWTLKEIGSKFDISAERVRQVLLAAKKAKEKGSVVVKNE